MPMGWCMAKLPMYPESTSTDKRIKGEEEEADELKMLGAMKKLVFDFDESKNLADALSRSILTFYCFYQLKGKSEDNYLQKFKS